MRFLTVPLAILALVFGLVLAQPIAQRWEQDNQHQRELDRLNEQQRQFDEEQRQQRELATLPGKIAADYGLYILLFTVAGGVLWVSRDAYLQRRVPLARFDADKPLVSRRLLELSDDRLLAVIARAVELSGQAQIARAQFQPGQQPHNYAPHISITSPKSAAPAELPYVDAAPELPAERPALALLPGECTLAALHRTGIVARSGNSLHVGNATADGTPIYMELATWGTLALGGKSRTGKTSRITYFLAQAALNGWRLIVLDKHGGGGKSDALLSKVGMLESSFLLPAAVTQTDMKTRIKQVHQIGKRRLDNVDTARFPIVLVIDEFTNLVLNGWLEDESLDQLMSIGNEYAGVNIHSIIIGHDWSASCLGKERGGAFRRTTTHRIAHRLDAAGAQFLLPPGLGKMAEGLTVGQAIYVDDGGEPILVDCPLLHDEDLKFAAEHAGRYLGTFQGAEVGTSKTTPAEAPGSGLEVGAEVGVEVGTSKHQDATNPRAAMVRQLLREKRTQNEIISQVWGASGGRAYQQAADELREIMAELVGGA